MNKKFVPIIILAISVLSLAFYWYEWRPTKIKERCSAEARFDMRAVSESDYNKRQEFINSYYNDCLMRFGLCLVLIITLARSCLILILEL